MAEFFKVAVIIALLYVPGVILLHGMPKPWALVSAPLQAARFTH